MKKITIALFFALACATSQAQLSIGAKAGVNISKLNGLSLPDVKVKSLVGFHFGGFLAVNLGKNFALQPELLYSTQGAKLEESTTKENLKLTYINIPVMVRFLSNGGFYLEGGPQIGFRTSAKFAGESVKEDIKSTDFSLAAGLGYYKGGFGIGARYSVGISKVGDANAAAIEDADYKNGIFQISLQIALLGGKKK